MHKKNTRNELRIIGGRWRGRRVQFPTVEGLRPTPDRVRETLFNWLQHDVAGSRCLDLFAGSGAVGLEALSRGAAQVTFVEREREAVKFLRTSLETLGADNAALQHQEAQRFLAGSATPFDIVFLDPPFAANDLPAVCAALESGGWLAPSALIYIESPSNAPLPPLPANWSMLKNQSAGAVSYHLIQRNQVIDASAADETGKSSTH